MAKGSAWWRAGDLIGSMLGLVVKGVLLGGGFWAGASIVARWFG